MYEKNKKRRFSPPTVRLTAAGDGVEVAGRQLLHAGKSLLGQHSGRVHMGFAGRQRDDRRFYQIAEIGKPHAHQLPV